MAKTLNPDADRIQAESVETLASGAWKPVSALKASIDAAVTHGDNAAIITKDGMSLIVVITKDAPHPERAEAALQIGAEITSDALLQEPLAKLMLAGRQASTDDVFGEFWGSEPSLAQRVRDSIDDTVQSLGARRDVLDRSLTRAQAADALGCSAQTISDHIETGTLLGLKQGREWRLPDWQFDADSTTGYLPDLGGLLKAFPGGIVSLTFWIGHESPDLGGGTPLSALRQGRTDEVIRVARSLTAAAW